MANLKDLIVNGVSRFIGKVYINDSHIGTINSSTVGQNPKFTDTVTTVTTTGSGNAVTAITASNGALTVTKGASYSNNAGTITGVTGGTGLSGSATSGSVTINHSNSVTAQTTQAIYPIKIDAQGHISAYGTAITPLTANSTLSATKLSGIVPAANLPSYVDDIIEGYYYNSKFYTTSAHSTEITGETGKIFVDLSTNKTYRYSGSAYVEVSQGSVVSVNRALTSGTPSATITIDGISQTLYSVTNSDTKNTAGSTDTSSKIFLIGATSQAANPQTYSHDTAYVGTDGKLYSNSKVVLTGGSNASSSVAFTPTTTSVYSMSSAGSVTAGTAASFTRGTFSQGTLPTLTFAMDGTDTKQLNITFGQGTLPTHSADTFTANTPTAVTLPSRTQVTGLWTGATGTAAAQTFTGSS